jgi:hypothetical protein
MKGHAEKNVFINPRIAKHFMKEFILKNNVSTPRNPNIITSHVYKGELYIGISVFIGGIRANPIIGTRTKYKSFFID